MRKFLLATILAFSAHLAFTQEMSITGADINQCSGFLVDNGMSAGNYTDNLDATITVSAPAPETIINLYWAVCALAPGDTLEIFDGPNTNSPSLGVFTFNDLQSLDITSTNAQAALTVHFWSDGSVNGNFGAQIYCGPPCERPFAAINTSEDPSPIKICPGETVDFSAAASQFYGGATLQSFNWDFDDGTTDNTSWPNVSHTFNEPGGYRVQLYLTDNNDCNSANLPDYIVMVSTYPDFSLISPEFDLCVGGEEYLGVNFNIPDSVYVGDSLNYWISEPWTELPQADLGGFIWIPDDQSQCFSDEITFSNFDPTATITQPSDLDYFFINFEHSFMGDITISFICPNGNTMIVHQQGGGGTWLGEPIDTDPAGGGEPGVGWDYFWDPDATLGTWANEVANIGFGGALPAGTYASVDPWTNLVGCPLNGTWEIQICDMWGADDGYIFDWSVGFNPQFYGNLISFTPEYGPACDSTYWEGPFIVDDNGSCDFIMIDVPESGTYDYTYYATNDFGCTFDTTITVTVFIAPEIEAGPDVYFECQDIQLNATIIGDQMPFTWEWTPEDYVTNPDINNPMLTNVANDGYVVVTGYPVGYPGCGQVDSLFVTVDSALPNPGEDANWNICPTAGPSQLFDMLGGAPETGGSWTGPNGLPTDPTFDPTTDAAGGYTYTQTFNQCELSATVTIAVQAPVVETLPDTTICVGGMATLVAYCAQDLTNSFTYTWSDGFTGNIHEVSPGVDQMFTVIAGDNLGCTSLPADVWVHYYDPLTVTSMTDTVMCSELSINLDALAIGGNGEYTFEWKFNGVSVTTQDDIDDYTMNPDGDGQICVRLTDGCETPYSEACFLFTEEQSMPFTFETDTTQGCSPLPIQFTLTTDPSLFTEIIWDFSSGDNSMQPNPAVIFNNPGLYDVEMTMRSPRGCLYSQSFEDVINCFNNPAAGWLAEPQPTTIEDTEITFTNYSQGNGLTYEWEFETENNPFLSTSENMVIDYPMDHGGEYTVSLLVTDENGCTNRVTGTVIINDILAIYIPNTFTPNGDGINDVFRVYGADIRDTDFSLVIFDRWGGEVYRSTNKDDVWMGDRLGSGYFLPDGVYNYRLRAAAASTTEKIEKEGSIMIIR